MAYRQPAHAGDYMYAPPLNASPLPLQHGTSPPMQADGMMHPQSPSHSRYGSFGPPPPPQYLQAGLPFDPMKQLASIPPHLLGQFVGAAGNFPYFPPFQLPQPPQFSQEDAYSSQIDQASEFEPLQSLSDAYNPPVAEELHDSDFNPLSDASFILPNTEPAQVKKSVLESQRIMEEHQSGNPEIMPSQRDNNATAHTHNSHKASDFRERALQAIREMHDNGITFFDLLNQGQFSQEQIPLLESLYQQANRPTRDTKPRPSSNKNPPQTSPNSNVPQNTDSKPVQHKLPAKLEKSKAVQHPSNQTNPLPAKPKVSSANPKVSEAVKTKTGGASTLNRPAPKSRQDYLAALSAAKALSATKEKASSQSSASPAPETKPLIEALDIERAKLPPKPTAAPTAKPVDNNGSSISISATASESEAAKRLNDKLRERIARLKGGVSGATDSVAIIGPPSTTSITKDRPAIASSPSTIDYGSRQSTATPAQSTLDTVPTQPSVASIEKVAPSSGPAPAIPGLFMSGQAVTAPQKVSVAPNLLQAQSMARKRPVAADFLESGNTTPKRPYMSSRLRSNEEERCIIVLSDGESSDSEGEEMEVDENNDNPAELKSLNGMILSTQFPIKSSPPPQMQMQDTRTRTLARIDSLPLSGMSSPQQRLYADEARRKEEEARKLRERIERLEARKKMGNQGSLASPVTKSSLGNVFAPSSPSRIMAQDANPFIIATANQAATAAEADTSVHDDLNIENNAQIIGDIAFNVMTQVSKDDLNQERFMSANSAAPTNATLVVKDQDVKRQQHAELDAGIAQNLSAIEKLKLELQRLEEENLRKQQDRDRLAKELENMGVDTKGMSHEAMQIKMEKLEQEPTPAPSEIAEEPETRPRTPSVISIHSPSEEAPAKSPADSSDHSSDEEGEISADDGEQLFVQSQPPLPLHPTLLPQPDMQRAVDDVSTNSSLPIAAYSPDGEPADEPSPMDSVESGEIDDHSSRIGSDANNEDSFNRELWQPDQKDATSVEVDDDDIGEHNSQEDHAVSREDAAIRKECVEHSGSEMETSSKESSDVEDESEEEGDYEPEDIVNPQLPQESIGGAEIDDYEPSEGDALQDASKSPDEMIADDLAPELQPTSKPTGNQMAPVSSANNFAPYDSPLKIFKAYRHHPEYLTTVPGGFQSNTYSHNIEPEVPICSNDIISGECKLQGCTYQHFRDINLRENDMLVQLGMKAPTNDPQAQLAWRKGLTELIQNLRLQNIPSDRSSSAIAAKIVEYRRQFLGDPSKVLNLGDVSL